MRDCANQFTAGRPGMHGQNHANLVPARSSTVAGLQSREYVHATSAGMRWLLLMRQHWARSRNRHTATDEKTRKVLSIFWLRFLWLVHFRKNRYNYCRQTSYFKAEMHQIRFRLAIHPRPRCKSLQRSLRPPSWI